MSKVKMIEEMLYTYFGDNKVHTIEEFTKLAIELGIIDEYDRSSVRNTLYKIKDYPSIKGQGNGKYVIYKQEKIIDNGYDDIEKAFMFLVKELLEYKSMDVIKNSFEELEKAKEHVEIYRKYVKELTGILAGK